MIRMFRILLFTTAIISIIIFSVTIYKECSDKNRSVIMHTPSEKPPFPVFRRGPILENTPAPTKKDTTREKG